MSSTTNKTKRNIPTGHLTTCNVQQNTVSCISQQPFDAICIRERYSSNLAAPVYVLKYLYYMAKILWALLILYWWEGAIWKNFMVGTLLATNEFQHITLWGQWLSIGQMMGHPNKWHLQHPLRNSIKQVLSLAKLINFASDARRTLDTLGILTKFYNLKDLTQVP